MKIGIVGLGLIGGTIAKALNEHHYISAYDVSQDTIQYALDNKIVYKSYTDLSLFLKDNEVVYVCLYPEDIVNFIFENKLIIPKNRVIIEISGIKKYIINRISDLGTLDFDIIYTHPVAGREKSGVRYSDPNIFKKANYIITPVKSNQESNISLAKKLAEEMGFLNISLISPEAHDDIIAYTSQLTHALSISLVNALSTDLDTSKYIGDSYRDLTRISIINDKLWSELFLLNKDALLAKLDDFRVQLTLIRDALIMNNKESLVELMAKSTSIRQSIGKGDNHDS